MSEIRATKRDPITGAAADLLAAADSWMRDPRRTQQMQGMADFIGLAPYATTLDRISYGEPLTKGKGWTLQAKPETADVALGLLGLAPTTKGLPVGLSIKSVGDDALAATAKQAAILTKFGNKAAREEALAKKVLKAASQADDAADAPAKKVRAAVRGKVEPDVYRTMAVEQGDDAVLRLARSGGHLKPDGKGGYIGAPRTVDSPQALGALRRSLDGQFRDAAEAVEWADPNRVGNWYDRAKQGIAMSTEPHQLDRALDAHAVYSAGVSPESELLFSLKHLNSRAVGEPGMAYRSAGMNNLDDAVRENRAPKLGFKIGEYRAKNDPRVPNTGLFGVNDFRAAQGFGYTTPDGEIWKGGVSPTMHPFMDAETALMVDRANAAGVAGRTDWQGPHLQELPWVYGKSQDLYERGSTGNGRFVGDRAAGVAAALREANNTAQDYFYKHAGSATYEAIPGKSTGHLPQLLSASPEEKVAYTAANSWGVEAPYTLDDAPTVGAGPRDALYSAVGFRQLPSIPSSGAYRNSEGVVENNPLMIARPLLDFPTGGEGLVASKTARAVKAVERFRAAMDAQEAGGYNLPNTMDGAKAKRGILFDSRPAGETITGVQPTSSQLAQIEDLLRGSGLSGDYGVSATSRGVSVFPYSNQDISTKVMNKLKKLQGDIVGVFPSQPMTSLSSTGYVPGIGKYDKKSVVPTAPYSGEATGGLLSQFASVSPVVSQNIGESEAVRALIRDKIARDGAMPGARGDIQNMRQFFAEADWPKAVEMIRRGMTPAAALAAMGYSINSMADDGVTR